MTTMFESHVISLVSKTLIGDLKATEVFESQVISLVSKTIISIFNLIS